MYKILSDFLNNKIVVYENEKIIELYDNFESIENNIYCAKVKNIIDGMNVAFCNIGINKDAMIQSKDIRMFSDGKIVSKLINKKEFIMVQVIKNLIGNKGPKLTENIKLVEKHVVMILSKGIYFSNKLNIQYKRNIEKLLLNLNCKYGVIIRSEASNISDDELIEEINQLANKFDNIIDKFNKSNSVQCLYDAGGIINKLINNISDPYLKIETNSFEEFKVLRERYSNYNVELVNKEIKYKIKNRINLKSGGYLIFENTFVGTVIDVNSGKDIFEKNNNIFLNVNMEAAKEIIKQIQLRDISGIIIIDFINLKDDTERKLIGDLLADYIKNDRANINLIGFTKLRII